VPVYTAAHPSAVSWQHDSYCTYVHNVHVAENTLRHYTTMWQLFVYLGDVHCFDLASVTNMWPSTQINQRTTSRHTTAVILDTSTETKSAAGWNNRPSAAFSQLTLSII